jgi:ribosomal protein L11 methyltransferase
MRQNTSATIVSSVARLAIDERSARRIADLVTETFDGEDLAVSLTDAGGGRWQVAIHFGGAVEPKALRALTAAAAGPAAAKALHFERIAATDWVRQSLAGLAPVRAGRFVVHGGHDRLGVPVNAIGIEIEAALAFGTGHHGTTRGCLLALDRIGKVCGRRGPLRLPQRGILDLGTGSGVLGIAAARALRQGVLATDIDPTAVRAARTNARLNRVGTLVEVMRADGVPARRPGVPATFSLIFANVLLRPLQRFAAPLRGRLAPRGWIVLSGLLASQANAALAAYRPLALERRLDIEGWTTLVLRRRARLPGVARRRREQ